MAVESPSLIDDAIGIAGEKPNAGIE